MNIQARQRPIPANAEAKRSATVRGETTDVTYQRLLQMAQELGPNAKLPPVRDLRQRFGVSQTTLDSALHRLERQNVLTRRERSGVYVAAGLHERRICVLYAPHCFIEYGESPFWSELFRRIRQRANDSGVHLTVAFADAYTDELRPLQPLVDDSLLPDWLREEIQTGKIHGVLTVGLPHFLARWIEEQGVPVVAFAGAAQYIIGLSYTTLILMGVAALVRQGYHRIAFWRFPAQNETAENVRFVDSTFASALRAHGLTLEENGVIHNTRATTNVEIGWELALRQFGPDSDPATRPDAVLAYSDMIAQGGLAALQRLGYRIGEEVGVATHLNKDLTVLRAWEDRIWRLEFDLDALVGLLFETLTALLKGGDAPASLRYDVSEHYGPTLERYRLVQPVLVPPANTLASASRFPVST